LASRDNSDPVVQIDKNLNTEQINKRLSMLDERLDNIDSIITSLVQRVMEKPITLEVTCPKCGQAIEVNITSSMRLRGKD